MTPTGPPIPGEDMSEFLSRTEPKMDKVCEALNDDINASEADKAALWRRIESLEAMLQEIVTADELAVEALSQAGLPVGLASDASSLSAKAKKVLATPIT